MMRSMTEVNVHSSHARARPWALVTVVVPGRVIQLAAESDKRDKLTTKDCDTFLTSLILYSPAVTLSLQACGGAFRLWHNDAAISTTARI